MTSSFNECDSIPMNIDNEHACFEVDKRIMCVFNEPNFVSVHKQYLLTQWLFRSSHPPSCLLPRARPASP